MSDYSFDPDPCTKHNASVNSHSGTAFGGSRTAVVAVLDSVASALPVDTLKLWGRSLVIDVFLGRERKVPEEGVRKLQEVGGKQRDRSERGVAFSFLPFTCTSSYNTRLLVSEVSYSTGTATATDCTTTVYGFVMCFIGGDRIV